MKRRFTIGLLLVVGLIPCLNSFSQSKPQLEQQGYLPTEARIYDSVMAARVPVLQLSADQLTRSIPDRVDNSKKPYFPGILDQHMFFSCQQHTGVAYVFAYENNRLKGADSKLSQNRYPTHYTWNFQNDGDRLKGVSFFYSWDVLKQQGHPTLNDYGDDTAGNGINWMSGYEKYYRGMKNRLQSIYSIPANTPEGVQTIKQYLYDHLNGSTVGGILTFGACSALSEKNFKVIPPGLPDSGSHVITGFWPNATHGMTIVGYNDSIRYDLNGDGLFTNDLDITNDGVVDVQDWEVGAYKMANSYGEWWADTGYSYVLYRALALYYGNNPDFWDPVHGAWNHAVYLLVPDTGYQPLLTLKAVITHNMRDKIRIRAGVSTDTTDLYPHHLIEFPIFNFQGGSYGMIGPDSVSGNRTLELGLDITPLLSFLQSNQSAKFFLLVDENDPDQEGEGEINQFSFIDYSNGVHEMVGSNQSIPIRDNDLTVASTVGSVEFEKVTIGTDILPATIPGMPYATQLEASGGTKPYAWTLVNQFEKRSTSTPFPMVNQIPIYYESSGIYHKKVPLPFQFPFYGKMYDSIYVNAFGFVAFESTHLPYMYLTDELGMLKRSKVISPAFNYNYTLGYHAQGMWMESNETYVLFRWKLPLSAYANAILVDFALRLNKDGSFEMMYGDIPESDPAIVTYSGFSNGDEVNFQEWVNWQSSSLSGTSFLFKPNPNPDVISLSKDGILTLSTTDSSSVFPITVRVTDKEHIWREKQLTLTSGVAISEELNCGADGVLHYGDDASFNITLSNMSAQTHTNIVLKLTSSDTSLHISDSLANVAQLAPGEHVTLNNTFAFTLMDPLRDQLPQDLLLEVKSDSGYWKKQLTYTIHAPEMKVLYPTIDDGSNHNLEPGEFAYLQFSLKNLGSFATDSLQIELATSESLFSIHSDSKITLPAFKARAEELITFAVQVDPTYPNGNLLPIQLKLNDGITVSQTLNFNLLIGKRPLLLVNLTTDTTSFHAMKVALDSLGVPFLTSTQLHDSLSDHAALFITTGSTNTNGHLLNENEGKQLSIYLNKGGKVYLEGYYTWYIQKKTLVHSYFHYSSSRVPSWFYPSLKGTPFSSMDSLSFKYTHKVNGAIFSFAPIPPAYPSFINLDSIPKSMQVVYKGGDYTTIGSLFEFGSLEGLNSKSTQKTLMRRYLDIFEIEQPGPKPLFHSNKSSICRWGEIAYTSDAYGGELSYQWAFPGGSPSSSTEKNPTVQYVHEGSYNATLTVSDGTYSRTLSKQNYITVQICALQETFEPPEELLVFPNPAHAAFTIRTNSSIRKMELFDLRGIVAIGWTYHFLQDKKEIQVDVRTLQSGLYLLLIQTEKGGRCVKVMID